MSNATQTRKSGLSVWLENFKKMSGADKRRTITDLLFNNAMYIIILIAVILINNNLSFKNFLAKIREKSAKAGKKSGGEA